MSIPKKRSSYNSLKEMFKDAVIALLCEDLHYFNLTVRDRAKAG